MRLPARRRTGHAYSGSHSSDDAAEAELRAYIGPAADGLTVRRIKFRSGHRETFWKRNCVAVGLAAGFLEPLESSAIVLTELYDRNRVVEGTSVSVRVSLGGRRIITKKKTRTHND